MRERICTFGPEQSLVGILTEPDPAKVLPEAPAVVLSNVGLNHHVGPYRLWVELARQLAGRGITTLRFDLSGLGDSRPRREGGSTSSSAPARRRARRSTTWSRRRASGASRSSACAPAWTARTR
ncbi:hypothetical protein [Corallococcus sp. 4LFB]|uniref:hypothetical protein n=1 Tax=Corallococcus sp. 4LFB TaxID=3383249 RepID=UPI0039750C4C